MDSLKISYQNPAALKPRVTNPRTHSKKKQIRQIADSIERFGFTNPVLIDGNGGIVAGHGRIEAAIRLGIEKVPTIRLADLSAAEVRAYVIADNKLAENAGWDRELLAIEFQGLLELELDIDVTITGFETPGDRHPDRRAGRRRGSGPGRRGPRARGRPAGHAARRHLVHRQAPPDLRRRDRPRGLRPPHGRRRGADDLYRPAL